MRRRSRELVLALSIAFATSPLAGQIAGSPPGREEDSVTDSFGLGNQDLFVPAPAFQPLSPSNALQHSGEGYYYAPNGGGMFAPLMLPAGARIVVVTCYFYDNDPTAFGFVNLQKFTYNTQTDTPGGDNIDPTIVSADAGGYHRVFESYDETVRYRPSTFTRQHYLLEVNLPATNLVRFRGCNVTFQRQVSPAPATATFADVPVGHPYHQFVEALVDSGITAGCGGGLYCVNNPITRGEMAVFVAAALGLHFPN